MTWVVSLARRGAGAVVTRFCYETKNTRVVGDGCALLSSSMLRPARVFFGYEVFLSRTRAGSLTNAALDASASAKVLGVELSRSLT